ncbi:hypothetical protein G6011_03543 [Alternaria panax]|uniref:Uncharacterized protein n=1 Tax=Alternaria panax TaxID=48097 RepID=A0AAD4NSW7_9PLEO|nr:hypothetical protein G6011_03543 [Alternaria panax]
MSTNVGTRKVKPPLAYHDAIAKGQRLLKFTIMDIIDGPPQSQFQGCGDLEEWGWGTVTLATTAPSPTADVIEALSPNPRSFPHGFLTAGKLTLHKDSVVVDGKTYPATIGQIQSVLNSSSGILLAECNTTPMAMINPCRDLDTATLIAGLPKLRYWSDVAFLQWKSLAPPTDDALLPELKVVVRYEILNADTRAICSTIVASLRKRRREKAKPGIAHDDWLPRWPGITFPMDSEEAAALCGTPNGSGVLWLLGQHKAGLGRKTVDKVTLLYREGNGMGMSELPTLIFYIRDVTENADIERMKNVIESGSLEV